MTNLKPEQTDTDLETTLGNPTLRKICSWILGAAMLLAVFFGAGVVKGFADAGGEDHLATLFGIVVIWFAVLFGLTWLAVKIWPNQSKEPMSPRTKRSRNLIYILAGIGAVLGLMSGILATDGNSFLSNGPLQIYPALIALAVWMIVMPVVTLMWWRGTDEHDRASYADGANIAGHAYLFIAPGWWTASRAGLLPQQDPMIVLIIVAVIWSAVWLYRKYF